MNNYAYYFQRTLNITFSSETWVSLLHHLKLNKDCLSLRYPPNRKKQWIVGWDFWLVTFLTHRFGSVLHGPQSSYLLDRTSIRCVGCHNMLAVTSFIVFQNKEHKKTFSAPWQLVSIMYVEQYWKDDTLLLWMTSP